MAERGTSKGGYTKHQLGAIGRFYEHADTRHITALQELVSELYLADHAGSDKAKDKLWQKASDVLARLKVEPARVQRAIGVRDPKALAELVAWLSARK